MPCQSFLFYFLPVIIALLIALFQAPNCLAENSNDNFILKHCCNDDCEKQDSWIDFDFPSKSISYRLEKGVPTCKELERKVNLDITKAKYNKTSDKWILPDLNDDSTFTLGNGTIEVTDFDSTVTYESYPENNYCIKKFSNKIAHFGICCTENQPCMRKCCPPHEHVIFESGDQFSVSCKPDGEDQRSNLPKIQKKELRVNYITEWPNCGSMSKPVAKNIKWPEGHSLRKSIGRNGKLFRYYDVEIQSWRNLSDSNDYCMDRVERKMDLKAECSATEAVADGVLFLCVSESPEMEESVHSVKNESYTHCDTNKSGSEIYTYLYTFCFIIAMLFLLATAIVKFLLWEKQNIHSWTILCYVMSLFFLYLCLIVLFLQKNNSFHFTHGICVFMGVMTHFLAFCAFSWLSVINFDLWWTFRVLTPATESKQEFRRFLWYCAFAFLIPVLMISVSLSLHFSYKSPVTVTKCGKNKTIPHPSTIDIIYPGYGDGGSCFLSPNAGLPYLYGPLVFLLVTNLLFYLTTTVRMFTLYKTSRRVSETSSKRQRQSCRLFLKLFVVAGLTWSSEIVYWFVSTNSKCSVVGAGRWYWALLDMANIFQAIAIFVIFVCKKETVRALEQKYPSLKAIFGPIARFTRSPNFQDRSTDGTSTKISRTELSKNGASESIQKQESIELS